jgi:hypothetical protein
MGVQREAGVRCGFISRGVVVYGILCRFGMWGGLGYLGWATRMVERIIESLRRYLAWEGATASF